jgi:predicted Zn-dependent protease
MALDVYSPCPGGTGRKIKFCCPDFLAELEKIDRMVEGEQYQACLDLARRLMEKSPNRACLMATECLMARMADRLEEAEAAAARFLEAHPENPLAWAETAITTAVTEGGRAAMRPLQKALE